jgi:hypothetical protein
VNDAAGDSLAIGRLVEPGGWVPLDEDAAAVPDVTPAGGQEPPPHIAVVGVDQE